MSATDPRPGPEPQANTEPRAAAGPRATAEPQTNAEPRTGPGPGPAPDPWADGDRPPARPGRGCLAAIIVASIGVLIAAVYAVRLIAALLG